MEQLHISLKITEDVESKSMKQLEINCVPISTGENSQVYAASSLITCPEGYTHPWKW